MQQVVAKRLARVVTVSEASRREIERCFGIPEKEVAVVYNGTDTERFRPHPEVAKQTDLIFVGRTEDRKKGIGTLLEALSLLPRHVTLKIVDGRIPPHGLVPTLVRRFGLEGRVLVQDRFLDAELVREYSTAGSRGCRPLRGLRLPRSGDGVRAAVVAHAAGALPE